MLENRLRDMIVMYGIIITITTPISYHIISYDIITITLPCAAEPFMSLMRLE
jgi:hypothetical protein